MWKELSMDSISEFMQNDKGIFALILFSFTHTSFAQSQDKTMKSKIEIPTQQLVLFRWTHLSTLSQIFKSITRYCSLLIELF